MRRARWQRSGGRGVSILLLFLVGGAGACTGSGTSGADVPADLAADAAPDMTDMESVAPSPDAGQDVEIPTPDALTVIAPAVIPGGAPLPLVVEAYDGEHPDWDLSGIFQLSLCDGEKLAEIVLRRGRGGLVLEGAFEGPVCFRVEGEGLAAETSTEFATAMPVRELGGQLDGDGLTWGPGQLIHVTADLEVPADQELKILEGTVVLLGPKLNIQAHGDVRTMGTAESPVLFAPLDAGKAWGGISHEDSQGEYRYTFFTAGGGDAGKEFGHSGSQPVLFADGGELDLDHVFLLDNPGKAMGGDEAMVAMTDSLVTRCDTGGEFDESLVGILDSHFLEMPSADGEAVDDDNDGLYLHLPHPSLSSDETSALIVGCVFAVGKDDGIDHNGATVRVMNTFIEGFHNEGIACSNKNGLEVSNTLITGCAQGIEAGYGSPEVKVDHCTLVDNGVGLRLGDSYDDPIKGSITVTNSISVQNDEHNVWNFSHQTNGPLPGQVSISHSMVDDPDFDGLDGNVPGQPLFDESYHLLDNSPGKNAASDGLDIGLL